jgi:hypothetical protein
MPIIPSFPVQNFVPVPYADTLTAVNVMLGTTAGVRQPAANGGVQILSQGHQSQVINTVFDWVHTYTGNAVSFNFQSSNTAQAGSLLDKILMVYVNNAENDIDVTVYFPDSGQFITCPAREAGYFPVMTNMTVCYVYNGTSGTLQSVTGSTQILFCNFAIPGFVSESGFQIDNYLTRALSGQALPFTLGFALQEVIDIYSIEFTGISCVAGSAGTSAALFANIELSGTPSKQFFNYGCQGQAPAGSTAVIFPGNVGRADFNPLPLRIGDGVNNFIVTVTGVNTALASFSFNIYYHGIEFA